MKTLSLIVALVLSARAARADTFIIDPSLSTLTLTGINDYVSLFVPQAPNSNSTTYSGTIDVSISGNAITFNSAALAAAVTGNWQPAAGGTAGSAPADYGITFTTPAPMSFAAVRNLVLDSTSNAIALTAGSFDSSQISIAASSGRTDYTGPLGSGSINLTTLPSGPNGLTPGTLTVAGGVETLTIPIFFSEPLSVVSPNDTEATFTGTIVATEAVPEPSTWVLVLGGVGMLSAFQWRRARHI